MSKCHNAPRSYRKAIPDDLRLRLWVRSGGRCAICNDIVYRDTFTLTVGNFADFAHIIAYSEDGPRGNADSSNLTVDYCNLILLCKNHHKMIDDDPNEWTVDKLTKRKLEHENRIEVLTSIAPEQKTHALVIRSNIGPNPVRISSNEVNTAIVRMGMYPSTELPVEINLGTTNGRGDESFYKEAAMKIEQDVESFLRPFDANSDRVHISVFSLTLMPLLVYFGKVLGDKHPIQLYQHHREPYRGWPWPQIPSYQEFLLRRPITVSKSEDVILKLALSDTIGSDKSDSIIGNNPNVYEISVSKPHTGFLVNSQQLSDFHSTYREILNEIQSVHGVDATVHLLMAVPCPIAIQCGLSLLQRKELHLIAYDYDLSLGGFIKALKIT